MPNNDPTKQGSDSNTVTTPPPVLEDIVLPPMTDNKPISEIKEKVTDTGSAAPSDDIVMQTQPISSNPRKKFAGGRVIATILGLFLLVGGLGAGVMLVGQNQNPNEQASSCYDTCLRQTGDAVECNAICKWQNPNEPTTPPEKIPECSSNGLGCEANEKCINGKCEPKTTEPPYSCNLPDMLNGYCKNIPTNLDCKSGTKVCSGSEYCHCQNGVECLTGICVPKSDFDTACTGDGRFVAKNPNGGKTAYTCCERNYVPGPNGIGCVLGSGGGTPTNPPSNPPKATPTPPAISASCQNLKAYPMSGNTSVPLTTAQLSALKSGNQFNLCVQGIKTGGSFDKVRFTINGVLQPEQAMTDRIGTTTEGQFCTVYTIPQVLPANGAFSFSAEMHHVTLGWK